MVVASMTKLGWTNSEASKKGGFHLWYDLISTLQLRWESLTSIQLRQMQDPQGHPHNIRNSGMSRLNPGGRCVEGPKMERWMRNFYCGLQFAYSLSKHRKGILFIYRHPIVQCTKLFHYLENLVSLFDPEWPYCILLVHPKRSILARTYRFHGRQYMSPCFNHNGSVHFSRVPENVKK